MSSCLLRGVGRRGLSPCYLCFAFVFLCCCICVFRCGSWEGLASLCFYFYTSPQVKSSEPALAADPAGLFHIEPKMWAIYFDILLHFFELFDKEKVILRWPIYFAPLHFWTAESTFFYQRALFIREHFFYQRTLFFIREHFFIRWTFLSGGLGSLPSRGSLLQWIWLLSHQGQNTPLLPLNVIFFCTLLQRPVSL